MIEPTSTARLVDPIRPKKIDSRGREDDPIVLSSDDEGEHPVEASMQRLHQGILDSPVASPSHRTIQTSPEPVTVAEDVHTDVPMSPVDRISDDPPFHDEHNARAISPPVPVHASPRVSPQPVASTSRVQLPAAPARRPSWASPPSGSSVSSTAPVVGTLIPRPTQPQPSPRDRVFPSTYRSSYRDQFMKLASRRAASNTDHSQPVHRSPSTTSGSKAPLQVIAKVPSPPSSEQSSNADTSSAQESMPDPVPNSEAPSSRVTSKSASVDPGHVSDLEERTQRVSVSAGKGVERKLPAPFVPSAATAHVSLRGSVRFMTLTLHFLVRKLCIFCVACDKPGFEESYKGRPERTRQTN